MFSNKKILSIISDVDILRTHIIPIDKLFCYNGKRRKRGTPISLSYWHNMKRIAQKYEATVMLGKLCNNAGEYNYRKCIIIMNKTSTDKLWFMKTFFHELSHRIQHIIMLRIADKKVTVSDLEDGLLYERAAERLAYFLWKKYLNHAWKINHASFKSYISKKHKKILIDWFEHNNGGVVELYS